jgi:2-hydroxy-6-oxonona-2,4-dienedioate hydrolase
VNGLRMHSRGTEARVGPRFLLIHGMVISSLYMIPLAEQLADLGYEVHAIDLPGYGRSEKPRAPLGVPALADSTAAWMEARGGGEWHLVGNSMGCQVCADVAARHPDAVDTVTLIGMTVDPAAPTLLGQALRLFRDMPREPWRLWLDHVVDYLRAGPRFAIGAMRSMMADRIELKLPRIAAPTLVMRGEHDTVAPRSWTRKGLAMLPRAKFVEIPNGSHAVHYGDPVAVAEAIRRFVEQNASVSTACSKAR